MAVAREKQWSQNERQRQLTAAADRDCKRRLWITRMAAALWIMAAAVEAARQMQRRRRTQRRWRQAENQNWCVLRQAVSGWVVGTSYSYLLTLVGSWRKMQMDLTER